MLHDPKLDGPSLVGFADFLSRQPKEAEYTFANCDICAIGQYAASLGMSYWGLAAKIGDVELTRWNREFAAPQPHTFRAVADRLMAE